MDSDSEIQRVTGETLAYLERFYYAPQRYFNSTANDIPPQCAIEFMNYISHLIAARQKGGDDVVRELKRARDHVFRALLDYYKYLIFFEYEIKCFDDFVGMAQIRIKEFKNIGCSRTETLEAYESYLAGKLPAAQQNKIKNQKKDYSLQQVEFNDSIVVYLKALSQIEIVMQLITLEKSSWIAGDVLNAFCLSGDLAGSLKGILYKAAGDFANLLIDTYEKEITSSPNLTLTRDKYEELCANMEKHPSYSLELLNFISIALGLELDLPV